MSKKEKKEVTPLVFRYILPDAWSEAEKYAKPVTAEEVVDAIKAGKKVEIINAVIEGSFILKSVNVEGEVTIQRTKIRGPLDWSYATFKQVLNLENSLFETNANFTEVTAEKDIFLNKVIFQGKATFSDIMVMGVFYCRSATFKKEVDFSGSIFKKRIDFFKSTFKGKAVFLSARIGSFANFDETTFVQLAGFNRVRIEESAFFREATFKGEANFVSTRIGSVAVFTEAVFEQITEFGGAQIESNAFFDPATFEGEANFASTRFGGDAGFTGAVFEQIANFDGAKIERDINFVGTVFADNVSFQNTSFKTIFFEENGEVKSQLQAKIDLRGCTYDRIHPISSWEELMERLEPYDRQPFTQLEETFRRAGLDELANDVYYKRKRRESAQKKLSNPGPWLMDRFLWRLTGYGVRLRYLFYFSVFILFIGTFIFHLEGAVMPNQNVQPLLVWGSQDILSYREAFWVSLNNFLPVEILSGAEWRPSSQIIWVLGIKFTTFATLLKLAGWILVPVGIAGISGILKR